MNIYSAANFIGITPANIPQWQPIYKVVVNGNDISATLHKRLSSLTLTDKRGFEADTLDLTLSDHDGAIALPPRGAVVQVWLGWAHTGLVYKGEYTAGCPEHSGAPDLITINAISSEFAGAFSAKKERSFHKITIDNLVKQIASEHGWEAVVDKDLAAQTIEHIDQQGESNAALLTRIAQDFDAISAVKGGKLLFFKAGNATTAGGTPVPKVIITRYKGAAGQMGDQHRFAFTENGEVTGVEAVWHNPSTGKRHRATAKKKKASQSQSLSDKKKYTGGRNEVVSVGAKAAQDDQKIKKLRYVYPNKETAERAAAAEWARLQRGVATFSLTLARGMPELFPETPAQVAGYKDIIDAQDWLVTQVTHSLSDSGYTASVEFECENPSDGFEMEHGEV